MSFNFPVPTTVGEIYTDTVTGLAFTWDGAMWKMGADSAAAAAPYVLKTGDTMTGPLLLPDPDPVVPLEVPHKKYVDRLISELALYQGTWQVSANIPNLNIPPNAPLNGYSWTAQTADPNTPEMAPMTIPGIGGRMIAALDTIKFSSALNPPTGAYEHIQGPVSVSQMVIADTPPAGAFHGQSWWDSDSGKQYVYFIDVSGSPGAWVQVSGGGGSALPEAPDDGTLYGRQSPTAGTMPVWAPVITSATIIGDAAPASPGVGQMWWNNTTGNLAIWNTTEWVQANVEEAPADGLFYARKDAAWAVSSATGVTAADLASVTTPVTFEAGWSGALDFRHNMTTVTVRLHNVKNSAAITGTAPDVKICGYPAGVTGPADALTSANIRLCTDDNFTPSTRNVMVRAKADGIYVGLYSGGAAEDTVANDRMTVSLSWAR